MNALQRHIALGQADEADTMNLLADACPHISDNAVWAKDVGAASAAACVLWLSNKEK
jgi:hypothetical protein